LEVGDPPNKLSMNDVLRVELSSAPVTTSSASESDEKSLITHQVSGLLLQLDSYKLAVKALGATVEQLLREKVWLQLQIQQRMKQAASAQISSGPYDTASALNPCSRTYAFDLFDQISNGLAKVSQIKHAMDEFE
jgi:hypothetical protein